MPRRDVPSFRPRSPGFVGRRGELAELAATLREARLVTVTGPGGVGKTRLALRAAAGIATEYDGIRLIELSGLRDPELLTHTVATVLGLPEQDARSRLDAVLVFLRDRRMLLVLDTCEHVLDAYAIFAETIATHAPRVTILATSRQPLDTPGEHVFPVAPLPVTGPHPDAVELFAQRAAAAAGFTLTDENLPDTNRAVPPPRRDTARHRTGRGTAACPSASRSAQPAAAQIPGADGWPAHRRAEASDAAHHHRVELRAVLGRGAGPVVAALGLRRFLRHRRR